MRDLKSDLDWRLKSYPALAGSIDTCALGTLSWNVLREDTMLPVAVIRQSALEHNRAWMKTFAQIAGVRLCPHAKTSMSPDLVSMQIADGAWGITVATVAQMRIFRQFGVSRIVLANQLIGQQNMRFVRDELLADPTFDFYCLVDSIEGIARLETTFAALPPERPLQVLIELGLPGGRSGVRDDAEALVLARHIAGSHCLRLRGIEAYEGIVQGKQDDEPQVATVLDRMVALGRACDLEKLFSGVPILSAGGSSFFDLVSEKLQGDGFEVILRSGCYLIHDNGFYEALFRRLVQRSELAERLGEGLRPALEVWGIVHSCPEPGLAIVGVGKRDISFDIKLPTPIKYSRQGGSVAALSGCETIRLDDQHAYVQSSDSMPLRVGDLVGFGISHPCTTFDRWRALFLVDDAMNIVGAVDTYF